MALDKTNQANVKPVTYMLALELRGIRATMSIWFTTRWQCGTKELNAYKQNIEMIKSNIILSNRLFYSNLFKPRVSDSRSTKCIACDGSCAHAAGEDFIAPILGSEIDSVFHHMTRLNSTLWNEHNYDKTFLPKKDKLYLPNLLRIELPTHHLASDQW